MASIFRRTTTATTAILLALLVLRTSALPSPNPSQSLQPRSNLQPRQDPDNSSCVFTNQQGDRADFTITIRNRVSVVDPSSSLGSGLATELMACNAGVVDVVAGLGLTYFTTFTTAIDDANVQCVENAIATVESQDVVCAAGPLTAAP